MRAHEIGHAFFYRRSAGMTPVRAPMAHSEQEEDFCDEFSRRLLIPAFVAAPRAAGVVAAHERYDVSLELAARAAARDTGARVTLWRWDPPIAGRRAALHVQWTNAPGHGEGLGVRAYRTDPAGLRDLLEAGDASAVVLEQHRQALAVSA